jgi:hypothetical protein
MKHPTKKALTPLSLFTIFLVLVVQALSAHVATASPVKDKALAFIEDVIQPDMSKYNITLVNDIVGQPLIWPSETQESVKYHLDNNGSGPDIICLFTNNVLTSALLSANGSSTFYSNLSADLTSRTLATLKGYQTYTGEDLQDMVNAFTNVDVTQNVTKISGNIKLTIQNIPFGTDISFKYTYNGTDYTGISFTFRNGQFYSFMDDRSEWVIGNTDVNINQSQAIDIAEQYVQNYSYTLDNGTVVKGFNVTAIQAALNFYPRNNSTTIYPYWSVQLNLDKLYPGNVWQLSVGIWADSGTVFLCQPIGFGGGSPPTATTIPAPPQQQQAQRESGITPIDLSIATGAVAAIAIIVAIVIKKRSK